MTFDSRFQKELRNPGTESLWRPFRACGYRDRTRDSGADGKYGSVKISGIRGWLYSHTPNSGFDPDPDADPETDGKYGSVKISGIRGWLYSHPPNSGFDPDLDADPETDDKYGSVKIIGIGG